MAVLTVIHTAVPVILDPAYVIAFVHIDHLEKARKRAPEIVESAAARRRRPGLAVTTRWSKGHPST